MNVECRRKNPSKFCGSIFCCSAVYCSGQVKFHARRIIMANLEVNFCGVRIKNPIVASSAEPTLNSRNMKKCIDTGAGGVIPKTMTDSPVMRELTTRSKWRFLNEKHEVCRGKVPRAFSLYGRSGLALEEPEVFVKKEAGAAAVTVTNRFIGFVPDIETGKPFIYGQTGVGGPWIKPLTLRWINEVRKAYKGRIFIAGTNGAYD